MKAGGKRKLVIPPKMGLVDRLFTHLVLVCSVFSSSSLLKTSNFTSKSNCVHLHSGPKTGTPALFCNKPRTSLAWLRLRRNVTYTDDGLP